MAGAVVPIPGRITLPPRELTLVHENGEILDTGIGVMLVSQEEHPSLLRRAEAMTAPVWSRAAAHLGWGLDGRAGDAGQLAARADAWYIANAALGTPVGVVLAGSDLPTGLYRADLIQRIDGQSVSPTVLSQYLRMPSASVTQSLLRRQYPTWSTEEIRAEAEKFQVARVTVEVVRGGREVKLAVARKSFVGPSTWAGADNPYQVPALTGITGASAGLGLALAYHEAISNVNITGEHRVAATGTLQLGGDGQAYVGAIAGLEDKVRGAIRAGYTVLLVPASQHREAEAALSGSDVAVIGVSTLSGAIRALCDLSQACEQ